MAEDDFAARLARWILEQQGREATPAETLRWELRMRQDFGGERYYVRKPGVKGKVASLANGLASGAALREVFASAGCSVPTGYRLLHRRWREW